MENKNLFDAVVLSGGGQKCLLTLGALSYFYDIGKYDMNHVSIYAGTSAGAMICLLLICGYTPKEIFMEIFKIDDFIGLDKLYDITDVMKFMGLITLDHMMDTISYFVKNKLGMLPTFQELYEMTNKLLVIVVSNNSKIKAEYYTHITEPGLCVIEGLRLSCNLPLICKKIIYNGDFISDGGLMDNFPLKYIDDGKIRILGIVIITKHIIDKDYKEDNLFDYLSRLIAMPLLANTLLRCELVGNNTQLIKLECSGSPILQPSMTSEEKTDMFINGYKSADYIDNTIYLNIEGWNKMK